MKNKCIIFSQSPSDIKSTLTVYENNYNKSQVEIYVVNIKSNFNYLNSLSLEAKIFFIPQINKKKIFKFLFNILHLKLSYRQLLKAKNSEVFFHSNTYDYITPFFIEKLSKNNLIFFHDIFNKKIIYYSNFIPKVYSFFVKIILGYNIFFYKISDNKAYGYKLNNSIKKIQFEYNNEILKKYIYKPEIEKSAVLLFESDYDKSIIKNYKSVLTNILQILQQKYVVYIKPHPRLGYSNFINPINNIKILDKNVPSEMLDIDSFEIILGNISTSIATTFHSKKICLIDLFEFKQKTQKDLYKKYLMQLEVTDTLYINNLSELKKSI